MKQPLRGSNPLRDRVRGLRPPSRYARTQTAVADPVGGRDVENIKTIPTHYLACSVSPSRS